MPPTPTTQVALTPSRGPSRRYSLGPPTRRRRIQPLRQGKQPRRNQRPTTPRAIPALQLVGDPSGSGPQTATSPPAARTSGPASPAGAMPPAPRALRPAPASPGSAAATRPGPASRATRLPRLPSRIRARQSPDPKDPPRYPAHGIPPTDDSSRTAPLLRRRNPPRRPCTRTRTVLPARPPARPPWCYQCQLRLPASAAFAPRAVPSRLWRRRP